MILKRSAPLILIFITAFSPFLDFAESTPPQVEISNGILKARLYLPNTESGYYRGSRFDWSGVIPSLEYKGHNFFGVWFPHYDPRQNDAITGPVEEFRSGSSTLGGALGYDKAKAGGTFLKIGVGVLRKTDDQPYRFTEAYEIVNPGVWTSRPERDRVEFEQVLNDDSGYSYRYQKIALLLPKRPELLLEHRLRNTGKAAIDTDVYDHDFYVLDSMPTGPGTKVVFTFAPKPANEATWPSAANLAGKVEIHEKELVYVRQLEAGEQAASLLTGFDGTIAENDIRVENAKAGIGVREIGDHPLVRLNFWSIRTTVCPEAYIHLHVDPGKEVRWRIRYIFYTLNQPSARNK